MTYAPYETFINGSYLQGSVDVFDVALGGQGFLFVFLYFALLIVLAITTESPAVTGVYAAVGGIIFYSLIPASFHNVFYAITVFAIAITIYKVFIYKRGGMV